MGAFIMDINDLFLDGLENLQRIIQRGSHGLTPAELKWQPHPDAQSIGLLLFQIVRVEDMATHDTMGKNPLWVTEQWHRKLNMPVDAGLGPLTPAQIAAFELPQDWQAYTAAVRNSTVKYVKGLKSGDFDRNVIVPEPPGQPVPPPPLPFAPTVGGILIHMLTELSCRAGKIEYIRGLQKISPSR
jgi:DinB superfamily